MIFLHHDDDVVDIVQITVGKHRRGHQQASSSNSEGRNGQYSKYSESPEIRGPEVRLCKHDQEWMKYKKFVKTIRL